MGTGASGDSGAMPAITPDMMEALEDENLAGAARRLLAMADATMAAMGEPGDKGDVSRLHLARQWQEAAVRFSEAALFYRAFRADEREAAQSPAPVPQQRKPRGHRKPRPNPGQLRLLGVAALGAAAKALRPVRVAGGHVLRHGPVAKLVAVSPVKAGIAAAGTAAVVAAGTAVVVTLAPSHAGAAPFAAGVPAPAASVEGAVPISVPPLAARVTPAARKAGKKPGLNGSGVVLLPPSATGTSGSPSGTSSSSSASSQSSAPAGPAVLSVSTTALDLSGVATSATFTITATGSGWASWQVTTAGTDLAFSATQGVLQAGQTATVTVSLAPGLDGLTQQVFEIAGQQVTVTLPLPVSSVVPSPAGSLLSPNLSGP